MISFPFPETATIVSRTVTGQDSYGNDVYSEVQTATSGAFAPEGSSELIQGQDTVITQPTFYLADGAPTPSATDRLIVRGVTFEVDGTPQRFHNPFTGAEPGAVVRLEAVTG